MDKSINFYSAGIRFRLHKTRRNSRQLSIAPSSLSSARFSKNIYTFGCEPHEQIVLNGAGMICRVNDVHFS